MSFWHFQKDIYNSRKKFYLYFKLFFQFHIIQHNRSENQQMLLKHCFWTNFLLLIDTVKSLNWNVTLMRLY